MRTSVTTDNWFTPNHDDVIKWKHFPRYWPFVRRIHRSPANSPHKGQWRGALMFTLICARIDGWVNNREAGDLRRYRPHYNVIVMTQTLSFMNVPKCSPYSVVVHCDRRGPLCSSWMSLHISVVSTFSLHKIILQCYWIYLGKRTLELSTGKCDTSFFYENIMQNLTMPPCNCSLELSFHKNIQFNVIKNTVG